MKTFDAGTDSQFTAMSPLELVYKEIDGLKICLDVYIPINATPDLPLPVLLWWHGGGLLQGTRKGTTPHLVAAPNKYGLCVVSADYRLAPQTRLPGILADCKDAIDFLRSVEFSEATKGVVDTSKVVVSGSSAGGWLALMAGTGAGYEACGLEPPENISGIAAIYPITDLVDNFWTTSKGRVGYLERVLDKAELVCYLDPAAEKTAFSALDSPRRLFYHYMVQEGLLQDLLLTGTSIEPSSFTVANFISSQVSGQPPPTYIIHGTIDGKVPVSQARHVVAAYKQKGIAIDYVELDVDHGFDKEPMYRLDSMYTFIQRIL
ncbi:hypothetical protein HGRIS_005446 [Hohenbuehelia grisea]|uniref:BD-FAE-like domain-containing protein n=1 Tax=Hohenbuehelia grisea TaxID=104357 RepID=A0ABR3JX18_9AGAR